jgi:hypothetical protein
MICERPGCRAHAVLQTNLIWLCWTHFAELTKGVWHH